MTAFPQDEAGNDSYVNPKLIRVRTPHMRIARLWLPALIAVAAIALVVLLAGCGGKGGGY